MNSLSGKVEALLFAAGDSVALHELAEALQVDKQALKESLDKMMDHYAKEDRGIMIRELEGRYVLCTKPAYNDIIRSFAQPEGKQGLSQAALEALSIIAYNQPVTRSKVEEIRGVNSDSAVSKLIEKGLIEDAGRLEVPGRPKLFRTTELFLKNFGFKGISSLPPLPEEGILENAENAINE